MRPLIIWNSALSALLILLYGWMLSSYGNMPVIENRIIELEYQTKKLEYGLGLIRNQPDSIIINNFIQK